MRIIVRIDDICPTMDKERFDRYIATFDEMNIKPLLGVIPENKDKVLNFEKEDRLFWDEIRTLKKRGYPVAMHGVHHCLHTANKGLVTDRNVSEFCGQTFQEQVELLLKGKEILKEQDLDTDIFMAPAHSYDKDTLKALKAAGFNYISDGLSSNPYMLEGIKCIPATSMYRFKKSGIVTMCLHPSTDYDGNNLIKAKNFVAKNRKKVISFEEAKALKTKAYYCCRFEEKVFLLFQQTLRNTAKFIK